MANEIANPGLGKIAGWSLTSICNLRCMHCYNDSGRKREDELSTEEALAVVQKLADFGVEAVNFGGGECALRQDFIEICEALYNKGIKISYTTNGTVLDIIKTKLHLFNDIGVSIDFADEKNHDLFRGREGTYKKAIECIDYLVSHKVNTEIVTCLTKLNSTNCELEKLYSLAKDHKVNFWRINRYRSTGRACYNDRFLGMNKQMLKSAFEYLSTIIDPGSFISEPLFRAVHGGKYMIIGDPSGKYSFRIQTNGDVSPSVFLTDSGGNIKDKSLQNIFDSDIFRNIRDRHAEGKCKSCLEYNHCQGGDAGMSYLAHGHFNGPDPMCFKDVNQKKNLRVIYGPKNNPNVHELYLCTLYIPIIGEKNE